MRFVCFFLLVVVSLSKSPIFSLSFYFFVNANRARCVKVFAVFARAVGASSTSSREDDLVGGVSRFLFVMVSKRAREFFVFVFFSIVCVLTTTTTTAAAAATVLLFFSSRLT